MKLKKSIILLFILLTIILLPNVVNASIGDTFTVDGLKYKVLTETTVEVIGFEINSTTIIIPSSVSNGTDNYKVSSIADNAFLNNDFAEEINIPSSVETIDGNVFSNCSKLKEIKVDANNAKYSAENGVLFNKNKTEIISYPEGKTETTYEVPNSVIKIGDYAFWKGDSLVSIELPNSLTTIGTGTFMFCEALKTINIPSSATTIGDSAFYCCRALTSIEIPNSVTTIGARAFEECDALTSINIPDSITAISDRMVYACDLLENITIPNTITSIGESAFSLCQSLKEIKIPNSVMEIKINAFSYTKIETINIPYGVKSIGTATFYQCSELKNIEIPYTVTSIGMNAFWGCTSLTELTIPYSVTSIGENAFGNCTSLTIYAQDASIAEKIAKENNISFEALYRIIINADEEGLIITPKGSTVDLHKGSDIDIEIKADTGYKLLSVKVNGVEQKLPLNNDMISIKDIKEDINLDVEVEKVTTGGNAGAGTALRKIEFLGDLEKQEFVKGTDKTLIFILDNDRGNGKVFVNGVELSEKNGDYTWNFAEGTYPTITLSEEYMKTLKPGKYTIKFEVENVGEAETTFTIVEQEKDSEEDIVDNNSENPKTGDNIVIYITTFIVSIIGISAIIINKKQNTKD